MKTLAKKLTIGDAVHFFPDANRGPYAAFVTGINPSGENRHIALVAFPPGQPPLLLDHVQHRLLRQADNDPSWAWPSADAAVAL